MVVRVEEDIYDTLGTIDGACLTCGSPARRMGWSDDHHSYWLMCDASKMAADDSQYGRCDLPTEAAARRRLGL